MTTVLHTLRGEVPQDPTVRRNSYEAALDFHVTSGLIDKTPDFDAITLAAS